MDCKPTPDAPGDEIAVALVPTDTLARADGADLRVTNSAGRVVPFRVLSVGPGSQARIAFAIATGRNTYAIYYGNPKADRPRDADLNIRRGLLMETFSFAGGNINSYDGLLAASKRSQNARQGADFVPNVFIGNNWFGPPGRTITRYSGAIQIPMAGEFGFATTSHDASFLLIDGKCVVEWPGYHGWVGDARHNGTVRLAAGLHSFEYWHVALGAEAGCVAAWKPPGADKWLPIPASAFLPVQQAELKDREQAGKAFGAEMTWSHAGEGYLGGDEDYVQRYRFSCRPRGFDPRVATFAWDFGDGLSVSGQGRSDVDHLYLADGPVDVTVTVTQGPQKDALTNRVVVSRHWPRIVADKPEPPAAVARAIQGYDFARLSPASAARAMELFDRTRAPVPYMQAAHALVGACAPVDDRLLVATLDEYAKFLLARSADEGAAAAVGEYDTAIKRAQSAAAKAALLVGQGRIYLDELANDPKAQQCFAAAIALRLQLTERSLKPAWIGMGDVHRRRGDGEKALAAYQSAEALDSRPTANQAAVTVGSFARSIEFYIRQGDSITARQQLEDWDRQFPTHRLNGYSTLLWVRFYQSQKMHKRAIQEATDLVAAAERSNYAPELLIAAAESWIVLKDPARAGKLLENVVAIYPDSPLAADARKKLAEVSAPSKPR